MKYQIPADWVLRKAREEAEAGTGLHFTVSSPDLLFPTATDSLLGEVSDFHPALGKLVCLLRRRQRLTIEALASKASIEASELIKIETDAHYKPQPRTVYQLAEYFKLPRKKLMALAGVTNARAPRLQKAAERFAASADPLVELSDAERVALEDFVRELGK